MLDDRGNRIRHGRIKDGNRPDDLSDFQDQRNAKAAIGLILSREDGVMINSIFESAQKSPQDYEHIFHFLREEVALGDLRLDQARAQLSAELIQKRIRDNISEERLDQWVAASIESTKNIPFPGMIEEVGKCVGGLTLARSLIRTLSTSSVLNAYLDLPSKSPVRGISDLFEGSQRDPAVAAEISYEFVEALRDKGDKPVLIGFFEGFKVEASVQVSGIGSAKVSWNSAPMMKAFIECNQSKLAREYEEFFRLYLRRKLHSGDAKSGKWQRQYDQHFQMLLNLKSGMFLPGVGYTYGERPSPEI